jgi:hypothetical protein
MIIILVTITYGIIYGIFDHDYHLCIYDDLLQVYL